MAKTLLMLNSPFCHFSVFQSVITKWFTFIANSKCQIWVCIRIIHCITIHNPYYVPVWLRKLFMFCTRIYEAPQNCNINQFSNLITGTSGLLTAILYGKWMSEIWSSKMKWDTSKQTNIVFATKFMIIRQQYQHQLIFMNKNIFTCISIQSASF